MKHSLLSFSLVFAGCLLTLPESSAKDPVFAMPISVPLLPVGDINQRAILFAEFSIVNQLWLRYLTAVLRKNQYKFLFFSVENTPRFLTFINADNQQFNYSTNEQKKREVIERVFMKVIGDYILNYFNLTDVSIRKGYDRTGICLKIFPGATKSVFFNRTLALKFADPPYGQSLAKHVITNRHIHWIVNEKDFLSKDYHKRANRNDLMYRYYHNTGHALGIGHYRSSADKTDIRIINNLTEYKIYVAAILATYKSLSPADRLIEESFKNYTHLYSNHSIKLVPILPHSLRSVMYANVSNDKKSAGVPTRLDEYVFRYIIMHFAEFVDKFIDRFVDEELSPLIFAIFSAARYFI